MVSAGGYEMRGIIGRGFAQTAVLGAGLFVGLLFSYTGLSVNYASDPHWGDYVRSVQAFSPQAAEARHAALVAEAAVGHGDCTRTNLYPARVASGVVVSSGDIAWYLTTTEAFAAHAAGSTVRVELFCYQGVRG